MDLEFPFVLVNDIACPIPRDGRRMAFETPLFIVVRIGSIESLRQAHGRSESYHHVGWLSKKSPQMLLRLRVGAGITQKS